MERLNWREAELKYQGTRMHSSRMRTIGSSSHVYPSMHWAEGCVSQHALGRGVSAQRGCLPGEGVYPGVCVCPGGVSAQGVSAWGGCLPRGVCLPGGCIPACTEADTPSPVKKHYLSATSFADGNDESLWCGVSLAFSSYWRLT